LKKKTRKDIKTQQKNGAQIFLRGRTIIFIFHRKKEIYNKNDRTFSCVFKDFFSKGRPFKNRNFVETEVEIRIKIFGIKW
jgi:hypothetical protein